jgi:hypothetical protein
LCNKHMREIVELLKICLCNKHKLGIAELFKTRLYNTNERLLNCWSHVCTTNTN